MTRSGIYARISSDRGGTGLGVRRQEEDCRALCETRGWNVAGVFIDNDTSAYKSVSRPGYVRLLDAVGAGDIDAIVAWHPDRLHRSPLELEDFIQMVNKAGVAVATVQAGQYDLSTAAGRMTARVVGAVARHESEQKSERIRRKALELAREGRVGGGGTRPFGYEQDRMTVREGEAMLIVEAANRVVSGEALMAVARDWQARGIQTPTGRHWKSTPLRRMLMSPRIAGLRQHRGAVIGPALWEPIIDAVMFRRLQSVLGDPRRFKIRGSPRRYLLSGMSYCSECGFRLVARPRGDKTRTYVCSSGPNFGGCGKIRAKSESLERFVADKLIDALDSPELGAMLEETHGEEGDQLLHATIEEMTELEESMNELALDFYSRKAIGRSEFLVVRDALELRLQHCRAVIAEDSAQSARSMPKIEAGERIRDAWDKGDFAFRRSLLEAVVDRVVVAPVPVRGLNAFQPERVHIHWRG